MSTVQPTDKVLVQRGTTLHSAPADMSTLQDTDLLLINRAGVDYKCTVADWKAANSGSDIGFKQLLPLVNSSYFGASMNVAVNHGATRSHYPKWIVFSSASGVGSGNNYGYACHLNGAAPDPKKALTQYTIDFGSSYSNKGTALAVGPDKVFFLHVNQVGNEVFYRHSWKTMTAFEAVIAGDAGAGTGGTLNPTGIAEFPGTKHDQMNGIRRSYGWYDDTSNNAYFYLKNYGTQPYSWIYVFSGASGALTDTISWPTAKDIIAVDDKAGILHYRDAAKHYGTYNYRSKTDVRAPIAPPVPLYEAPLGAFSVEMLSALSLKGSAYSLTTLAKTYSDVLTSAASAAIYYANGSALFTAPEGWYHSTGGQPAAYVGSLGSMAGWGLRHPPHIANQVTDVQWVLLTAGVGSCFMMSLK